MSLPTANSLGSKHHAMDIGQAQQQIESLIDESKSKHTIEAKDGTKTYQVRTNEADLSIIIGPKWIGYDLAVKKDVFGHEIGAAVDTDNYSLDGDYAEAAEEIFAQVKMCLTALLKQEILVGEGNGSPFLAMPLSGGDYDLRTFHPRKGLKIFDSSETKRVKDDDIQKLAGIRPLT